MKEITSVITDLAYKKYDKIRIAQELLRLKYSPEEIKVALKKSKVKHKNINFILAICLIILGIIANFYTRSTYINNFFRFDFFSTADFMLFNERILKPTLSVSFIILGINLLINKVNISKNLKIVLYALLTIFTLFITAYISIISAIFSLLSLFLVWSIELPQIVQNLEMVKIFPKLNKNWKGSSVYVFIVLGSILIHSARIEFVFVSNGDNTSSASLGFVDYFLMYVQSILFYGGLLIALLLSLDFNRLKISLFILAGLSTITLLISLFHANFQNIIYGNLIIILSAIVMLFRKSKLGKKD